MGLVFQDSTPDQGFGCVIILKLVILILIDIRQVVYSSSINILQVDLSYKIQPQRYQLIYLSNTINLYQQINFQQQNLKPRYMSNELFTAQKDLYKATAHKSDFSFSSPHQDPTTLTKQALLQSRRIDIQRNRKQLFNEMKQNVALATMINKSYSKDFVEQLRTEQRVEVEKLLLEISRLHDLLQDQEKMHRHAIQRLKQQSQQIALLRISNLKQSQISQLQALEIQLRKTKQALEQKANMLEQLQRNTSRKIQNLSNQNQILRTDLKQFVQKKNLQIYQLRNQFSKQNQNTNRKQEQVIEQLKALADRQLKRVLKKLQQKQKAIQGMTLQRENTIKQNNDLQITLQKQRLELTQKLQKIIQQQKQRQNQITRNLKQFYMSESEGSKQDLQHQRQLYQSQIEQLMKVINIKDEETRRNLVFKQTQKIDFKLQIKNYEQENNYLKKLIAELKKQHLKQLQLLKVKMAVLHQSDIEALVKLYQAKLQSLVRDVQYAENQADKATKQAKKQRQNLYQLKKKYDFTVSFLNQQILELKNGASTNQQDMKQRLQNQKSMMMLTSRNFIKENQIKSNNIRFYEQQLRKLRQLLQIQAQQVQQSERNVEQKIKLAEDQLGRLSSKIIQVKSQAEQNEKRLKKVIQQKNHEIKKLNEILNTPKIINKDDKDMNEEIKRLDEQIAKRVDQVRSLKIRCENIQSDNKILKAENQRLGVQAQITGQDGKTQFKKLSEKNLADMKAFYDRRLQELENDKRQLAKINSSQSEQITELIKKYKQLQQAMKILVKQTKKRGDLQARIIQLGMDNNLVKNMAELFHK